MTFLGGAALRLENPPIGRGILEQFAGRPDGARHQIAPAIGADALELFLGAGRAKSAFIGADTRLGTFRRQILVAAFAAWSQFEHCCLLPKVEPITRPYPRQLPQEKERQCVQ